MGVVTILDAVFLKKTYISRGIKFQCDIATFLNKFSNKEMFVNDKIIDNEKQRLNDRVIDDKTKQEIAKDFGLTLKTDVLYEKTLPSIFEQHSYGKFSTQQQDFATQDHTERMLLKATADRDANNTNVNRSRSNSSDGSVPPLIIDDDDDDDLKQSALQQPTQVPTRIDSLLPSQKVSNATSNQLSGGKYISSPD